MVYRRRWCVPGTMGMHGRKKPLDRARKKATEKAWSNAMVMCCQWLPIGILLSLHWSFIHHCLFLKVIRTILVFDLPFFLRGNSSTERSSMLKIFWKFLLPHKGSFVFIKKFFRDIHVRTLKMFVCWDIRNSSVSQELFSWASWNLVCT